MKATLSYDNARTHTPLDTESHPRRLEPCMEGVHDPLLQIKSTMFLGQDFIICKLKLWLIPTHLDLLLKRVLMLKIPLPVG
jgi:hypothetical protein